MNKKNFLIALIVIILAIGVFVFIRNNNSKQTYEVETMEGTYKLVDVEDVEKDDKLLEKMSKTEWTIEIKANKTFTMHMSYNRDSDNYINNSSNSIVSISASGSYDDEYLYLEKSTDLLADNTSKENDEDDKVGYIYEGDKIKLKWGGDNYNDIVIFQKVK